MHAPSIVGEASISISKKPEAKLYGKASLAELSGKRTFTIHFTSKEISIGWTADLGVGGGLIVQPNRVKVGVHFGIGVDIEFEW